MSADQIITLTFCATEIIIIIIMIIIVMRKP